MRTENQLAFVVAIVLLGSTVNAQQVTKETVPGIRNLARLETTVACAGTITPEVVPEIGKMGFVSIINLREATEPGAEIEKEGEAARAAGLKYFHVPFNGASPDIKAADQFLAAITSVGRGAGIHSLLRRQPCRRDVADQTDCGRSLGC